jgi:hypothetical protein
MARKEMNKRDEPIRRTRPPRIRLSAEQVKRLRHIQETLRGRKRSQQQRVNHIVFKMSNTTYLRLPGTLRPSGDVLHHKDEEDNGDILLHKGASGGSMSNTDRKESRSRKMEHLPASMCRDSDLLSCMAKYTMEDTLL